MKEVDAERLIQYICRLQCMHQTSGTGEMPERSKGAVLKTAVRKYRGFESLSLR
jgi:hypothetical protein